MWKWYSFCSGARICVWSNQYIEVFKRKVITFQIFPISDQPIWYLLTKSKVLHSVRFLISSKLLLLHFTCICPEKKAIFHGQYLFNTTCRTNQNTARGQAGLHKLCYPTIRDRNTWSKFGAHGDHGDVFLFSNLGALWFSENLIRYSLHVCLREVKNNLFSFKHSYLRHFSWWF